MSILTKKGSGISLVPACPDTHGKILLAWRNSDDWMRFCTVHKHTVVLEDFYDEMRRAFNNDRHEQYVIYKADVSIGTIYSYGYSAQHRHVFISVFISPEHRLGNAGIISCLLLLERYLSEYEIVKAYTDVYAYNLKMVKFLEVIGFAREGHFRKHARLGDEWHDMYRFAVFAEQYEAISKKIYRAT